MRPSLATLVGMAVLVLGGRASAQSIKDPAEVLPAKTLAYVELRQPGALLKEAARLLEGSYLANVPESLAPISAKYPMTRRHQYGEVAIAGLVFAPEVVQEVSRMQGAAFAITGMSKEDREMPEFVVIIRPGDSNVASFMARGFLLSFAHGSARFDGKTRSEMRSSFERIAEVEGVALYGEVRRWSQFDAKTGRPIEAKKPEIRANGIAMARLPDAILIGTGDLVKDVIGRAKGKASSPSLAGLKAFQKASKDFDAKPGLIAFANPPALLDFLEKHDPFDLGRDGADFLKIAKGVVNPKAFEAVADQLTLENGTLAYRRRVYLNPEEKSPLLETLPRKGVSSQLLHFAPADSLGLVALSNDDGEKRLKHLIELADGVAKALGADDLPPSGVLAKLEARLGVDLVKDLAAKIQSAAIVLPGLEQIMKASREPPMVLLIEGVDIQAATSLEKETLPKLFTALGEKPHARVGNVLILGMSKAALDQAVASGKTKKGLLGDEKLAKRIQDLQDPFALAMLRPMTMAGMWLMAEPRVARPPDGDFDKPAVRQPVGPSKSTKMLLEALKAEEPLLLGLTRTKDQLTAQATYTGLHPLVARITNFILEESMRPHEFAPRPPIEDKGIDKKID